jgi:hypothetical protein
MFKQVLAAGTIGEGTRVVKSIRNAGQ